MKIMTEYKRKFSRISFINLIRVSRYWCELFLGYLIIDRHFYLAVPLIELAKALWIGTKVIQCVNSLKFLIIWELEEI